VLEAAIAQVQGWREELATFEISHYLLDLSPMQTVKFEFTNAEQQLRTAVDTLNLLDIAYLILKSAAWRTESRGGHYRTDYPQTSPTWQVHTLVQGDRTFVSSAVD
jgi:L-aspartate oxidase